MLSAAQELVHSAIADALMPPPRMPLSAWAGTYREMPNDVSANPGRWDNELFPFLQEIMDCLNPWHPSESVAFCKSAQVGGTEVGVNWMFAIADMWPGTMLMVHPTILAAQAWVREKLAPSLRASSRIEQRVAEQKSRDGSSTTLHKAFAGGYWVITGANSASDISSKSIRFVLKEELDRWPLDVDGQGDPEKLVDARQTSYHASGKAKTFAPSTPTVKDKSRIWRAFQLGDQRHYHVPCPHCDEKQVLRFFPDGSGKGGLIFNDAPPYEPHYACEHCGALIAHHHKLAMIRAGEWVAANAGAGKQPSFHINALYSPVTTWEKMVEAFLDAKDDQQKLKTFYNLWLGLPWEERGEAPDWDRLYARREDYRQGTVPLGGLFLTAGADVQKDGIFFEVVAWGVKKTSWSVDIGFLPGDTGNLEDPVWRMLSALYERGFEDAFGNIRRIEAFAIDSGFNTSAVYAWARRWPNAFAIKGQAGWNHPPIGTPKKQEVNAHGKKIRRGLEVWPVGTWTLKSEMYANLRKKASEHGELDAPGYCHFASWHDEGFFKQLTAESIKEREHKGRIVREWVNSGPNHYHDCRVYAMAMAEHLGISRLTEEMWGELAARYNVPTAQAQPDLFTPSATSVAPGQNTESEKTTETPVSSPYTRGGNWISPRKNWIKKH